MPWVHSYSSLEVTLCTVDGIQLKDGSKLTADTPYLIKIKSEMPLSLKIKLTDGFKVEGFEPSIDSMAAKRLIFIKTDQVIPESIYINLVPVAETKNGLIRESPQSFLLPNIL